MAPTRAAQTSASLTRIGSVIGRLVAKPVAASADRLDRVAPERTIDLLAQVAHVDVDDVRNAVVAEVPDMLDDPRSGQDLAVSTHEIFEERELFCGELDHHVAARDALRRRIEAEVARTKNRGALGGAAPRERADACEEFAEGEGLHQIVVGPRVQSR